MKKIIGITMILIAVSLCLLMWIDMFIKDWRETLMVVGGLTVCAGYLVLAIKLIIDEEETA